MIGKHSNIYLNKIDLKMRRGSFANSNRSSSIMTNTNAGNTNQNNLIYNLPENMNTRSMTALRAD